MDFDSEKKKYLDALYKPDRSKKGDVDSEIRELIDLINDHNDYFTTSSCAGRIVLIELPDSNKKDEAEWFFVSHKPVEFDELNLENLPDTKLWLKQESAILHVCCRSLEAAQQLVDWGKVIGFKRSGIMVTGKRFMVEVCSTESITTLIAENGKLVVDKGYIKTMIDESNKKLLRTREKIDRLCSLVRSH